MQSVQQSSAIDQRALRSALGAFTTGVTIVTTRDEAGRDVGLTANSFNSVSLDPPLVLWSLAKSSSNLPAFLQAQHFAVHVLAATQDGLSNLFAKRGADRFAGLEVARGHGDVPLLHGCAARFECRTAFRYEGGDHQIFVGEVLVFEHFERPPLVYQQGAYALAVRKPRKRAEAAVENHVPESSFRKDFLVYLLGCAHSVLMARIRPALHRHGLRDEDYYVLSILGVEDGRTLAELDALLRYAGREVGPTLAERLVRLGMITVEHARGPATALTLTEKGRRTIVELVALSKAVEEDALQPIDHSESQMLKHLLKRLIGNAAQELPALWRGGR
ncbi:MAG TPA: flavin reductase [Burkholderiaceae bacterium]|nr:flavin reductase [Burkholderiaceae bacterium]